MFTMPPTIDTNNASVREADTLADSASALQSRFPGWTYLNSQYNANGNPHKAHIRDRSGRVWTVWFNANEQITHIAQGND